MPNPANSAIERNKNKWGLVETWFGHETNFVRGFTYNDAQERKRRDEQNENCGSITIVYIPQ